MDNKLQEKLQQIADLEHPMPAHAISFKRDEARALLDITVKNERLRQQNAVLLGALKALLNRLDVVGQSSDEDFVHLCKNARAAIAAAREEVQGGPEK